MEILGQVSPDDVTLLQGGAVELGQGAEVDPTPMLTADFGSIGRSKSRQKGTLGRSKQAGNGGAPALTAVPEDSAPIQFGTLLRKTLSREKMLTSPKQHATLKSYKTAAAKTIRTELYGQEEDGILTEVAGREFLLPAVYLVRYEQVRTTVMVLPPKPAVSQLWKEEHVVKLDHAELVQFRHGLRPTTMLTIKYVKRVDQVESAEQERQRFLRELLVLHYCSIEMPKARVMKLVGYLDPELDPDTYAKVADRRMAGLPMGIVTHTYPLTLLELLSMFSHRGRASLPAKTRWAMIRDVAVAMESLHAISLVHANLQPSAVLVEVSGEAPLEFRVVLGGFDFCLFGDEPEECRKQLQWLATIRSNDWLLAQYLAPEFFLSELGVALVPTQTQPEGAHVHTLPLDLGERTTRRLQKGDVFSFGMLAFTIASGEVPWAKQLGVQWSAEELRERVARGERPMDMELRLQQPMHSLEEWRDLWHLVQGCVSANAADRPSFQHITQALPLRPSWKQQQKGEPKKLKTVLAGLQRLVEKSNKA